MSGNRLDAILATTRAEVARRKAAATSMDLPEPAPPRGFHAALAGKRSQGHFGLIAEIKRASPSRGLIRLDFDPASHAHDYAAGGAACLSVLTDEPYFQGSLDDLVAARAACALPVLRKDFMVDPWQVAEARAYGADAILLIVAALEDSMMVELESAASEAGMDVLVEVHDRTELDRALRLRSGLIGINTRDLRDFSVDPRRAWELAPHVPEDRLVVAESGLATCADLRAAEAHGIGCFLVGEALMRQADVTAATRALLGEPA